MAQIDINYMTTLMNEAREVSKQLKLANQLKVLELKLNYPEAINMIDSYADSI